MSLEGVSEQGADWDNELEVLSSPHVSKWKLFFCQKKAGSSFCRVKNCRQANIYSRRKTLLLPGDP
jgi:hypothetical protein